MTHMHIPTLPTPRDAVANSRRKHVASAMPLDAPITRAECRCGNLPYNACPKHNPGTYADCMARHATDSFGPPFPALRPNRPDWGTTFALPDPGVS
jgi:hypothetical protein